ncbi:hypothetical protein DNU06_04800 [Putridiphycobacter roseus]|uniref:POTRA domain-containing protein n=1 Tax=Putridiphycobacter roseus TaxID=2219161 RepID=A0A2W1N4E8_9FLAO|nr:POTRA domain-containing protein [Putridiphycobacter roseus]PZE17941.1 hypothetical protein DNU06_04800 [Putridiphycobacter roseus]
MKTTLLFLCIFFGHNILAQKIEDIDFEGLTKTKPFFLHTHIQCKAGMPIDSVIIEKDVQQLRNLNLFFKVESKLTLLEDSSKNYRLTFIIEEANYIFPILLIGGFKDIFKLEAGLNNINYKGEGKTIGAWYQYYDRHSFSFYHNTPKYLHSNFGHNIVFSKYSTIEPLYFKAKKSFFNYDNYALWLNAKYWLNKNYHVDLGFTPMYEKYRQLDSVEIPLVQRDFTFFKFRINSGIHFKKINYLYERISGIKSTLYTETIQTKNEPMASFFLVKLSTVQHFLIHKKGNLSYRHVFGLSTNKVSPFTPFVLDGFLNIRGIGNRIERGTGIHFINLEYKHTIYQNKILILQSNVFLDAGTLRAAGEKIAMLFSLKETKAQVGFGLRLHTKKYYKTIFRLDYGIGIHKMGSNGFSFGMGQFF